MKERTFAPAAPLATLHFDKPRTPEQASASEVQLVRIRVELIDENPNGPREHYTPEMISEMARRLREQGQQDPIHVYPNPDRPGRYIICDGWTRTQACAIHRVFDELLARVHTNVDARESGWLGFFQNESRNAHCDLDRAWFFKKMLDQGMTSAEVARRANISEAMMSNYRAFFRLPAEALEVISANAERFGASIVYQLVRIQSALGERRAISDTVWYAENPLATREKLIARFEQHLAKRSGTAHRPVVAKHIRFGNGYYKTTDEKIQLQIKVAPEKRAQFEHALEALLETVREDAPSAG